jgi:hypothetical protein
LTSESRSEVAALSALQQHDRDQEKANDYVNDYDQNSHCKKTPSGPQPDSISNLPNAIHGNQYDGAEGGI